MELSSSRDAWASHTTLQTTAVQQLQRENTSLKEELIQLRGKKRKENPAREKEQKRAGERVMISENTVSLERVERELFETNLQLEAKVLLT